MSPHVVLTVPREDVRGVIALQFMEAIVQTRDRLGLDALVRLLPREGGVVTCDEVLFINERYDDEHYRLYWRVDGVMPAGVGIIERWS